MTTITPPFTPRSKIISSSATLCLTPRLSAASASSSPSASSHPSVSSPPLGSPDMRRRSLGNSSIPHCRRKSSASLSAGIAAAAAVLSASPNLYLNHNSSPSPAFYNPVSPHATHPSVRGFTLERENSGNTNGCNSSSNSNNGSNSSNSNGSSNYNGGNRGNETIDEDDWGYGDQSPSAAHSRSFNLESATEETFNTHDELYDCSEEEEETDIISGEELPPPSHPLSRALAIAREVRLKLNRKGNAIEGLTRIKDGHFLNSKSKLIPSSHFNGKVLGLFLVGSHSLKRCAEVLPEVTRWFQQVTAAKREFDIVIVWLSASILDPSGAGFNSASQEYEQIRKLSTFHAAPFNSPIGVALYNMFCHKGTPSLVILDTDGAIINTNGLRLEGSRVRLSDELGEFPYRPDFDKQAKELFEYLDTDQDGVLTRAELLAQSDNQESGEYVYEKLLLESEGGQITSKVWSALLLTQLRASAGHQSDMEEILDSFQDIFCFRPDSMSPAHR